MEGHGRKRAQGVDGIEVAEEQDWLGVCRSGEIDLEIVAVIVGAMQLRATTDEGELLGEKSAHAVAAVLLSLGDSISTNSRMVWSRAS